ncbi:hypothetical protein Q5M86_06875, partial [Brachyspira innocens]|nr:hypothetical protein [Brachyspira innocens]
FLVIFTIKYFNDNIGVKSIKKYIVIFVLILGSYNSVLYIENQISYFLQAGIIDESYVVRKTFNNNTNNDWVLRTMTCQNIDNSVFFKYIAKDKKQ